MRNSMTLLVAAWIVGLSGSAVGDDVEASPASDRPRVFYVDSQSGDDGHAGQSEDQAWQSLDRVNAAELAPGDVVRFRCGGVWRGSLRPISGDDRAPVTYTAYGSGPKPTLLGSRPRNRPEDWVQIQGNIWATLPLEYRLGEQVLDLRKGSWTRHQEAGANVELASVADPQGLILRFTCTDSGRASNHVQVWGPTLPVEQGTCLQLNFRARSSKPCRLAGFSIRAGSSPWNLFGSAGAMRQEIGPEWGEYQAVLTIGESAPAGRLHFNLGGLLPAKAVLEFQPLSLRAALPSLTDPLVVDVGNIIFDQGRICGWKKWSVEQLTNAYDYYYDPATCRVWLNSPGNPAQRHESIELALRRHVVDQGGAQHVVYDGLAVKYGAAHGFGGGNTHHLVIRNCDLSYIGGGHQFTRPDGVPVRFGNAIEFWGAAHDNLVEGCRIWEVYDAALTNQGRSPDSHQVDITYRDNVIWNSEYSFEYWNHPETAVTRNIRFVNNTCVNAGTVWSHAQRPDRNGSHLMFYSNTARTSGIEVKYNIFCHVTEWGSRYDAGWKTLPDLDHNLWFSREGMMAYWFRQKLADFGEYRRTTGLDAHSRFADPKFLDEAGGDFRLAPDSPARSLRPDGGPVGASLLWDAKDPPR